MTYLSNFSLLLFVFGVNFEYWDPFGLQGIFSVTKITAIIYILTWIPQFRRISLGYKPLLYFCTPIFVYLFIEFVSSAINIRYADDFFDTFNFKVLQLIVLLILVVNHINNNPRMLNWIIYSYIANVVLLSILSLSGIGVELGAAGEGGRLLLFGENPNMVGMKASFAVLIILHIILTQSGFWNKAIFVGLLVLIFSMLIATASRGALLSVFIGLSILVLVQKITIVQKGFFLALGLLFSFAAFNYVLTQDENFAMRLYVLLEEGNTGRNSLWEGAFQAIMDNPLIGVGRPGALPTMEQYIGRAMDPHNVFLYVFMTTGIVGFMFFITFLYRLAKKLYTDYKLTNNGLYLSLFGVLVFNMSKAGGFINHIFLWFFLSVLIGSVIYNRKTLRLERRIL